MNVYYFCPAYRQGQVIRAGVKRLYHHVRLLNDAGISAFILFEKKPGLFKRDDHFPYINYISDVEHNLHDSDIIVFPETFLSLAVKLQHLPARKFILCLSTQYVYDYLREVKQKSYKDFGIERVVCCSGIVKRNFEYAMDISVDLLPFSFNSELYFSDAHLDRVNDFTFMYSKRKGKTIDYVLDIFTSRNKSYKLAPLQGFMEVEYAKMLRESKIYLSVTIPKGIPTDCMEAMASGCIVVGYAGIGGHQYLKDGENCFLVDDNDYFALAMKAEEVYEMIRAKSPQIEAMKSKALKLVREFTLEKEAAGISDFYRGML